MELNKELKKSFIPNKLDLKYLFVFYFFYRHTYYSYKEKSIDKSVSPRRHILHRDTLSANEGMIFPGTEWKIARLESQEVNY